MTTELLAPAGDIEAGYAALHYGADAVYLGLRQFSARAGAINFDEQQLDEFTAYAHSLGRQVFVAVNTLIHESELPNLLKTLDICAYCGVDALIVQDLGVAQIVRKQYPQLVLHASTQMAVHNKEGALYLQKLGFRRVVLARELTLNEIKEIAAIPDLETEVFIHGALCYSYSGLCLFSALEHKRSANRGQCVYPCRAEFAGGSAKAHYFSMKDLALQEDIAGLPVTSLKIEGRKKTALYVAAVTAYYRRILDHGKSDPLQAEQIRQIFARPWTKLHFRGRNKDVIDRNWVGHRGLEIGKIGQVQGNKILFETAHPIERYDGIQIDVPGQEKPLGFSVQFMKVNGRSAYQAQSGDRVELKLPPSVMPKGLKPGLKLYLASASAVKSAFPYVKPKPGCFKQRLPLRVSVKIETDRITASVQGIQSVLETKTSLARDLAKVTKAIEQAFAKTGDSAWQLSRLSVENPQELFVPISVLNELRRDLYSHLSTETVVGKLPDIEARSLPEKPQWLIRTDNPACLAEIDLTEAAEISVLIDENFDPRQLSGLPKNKLRLVLPPVCRRVALLAELVQQLLTRGYRRWEISNYYGHQILPEKGIDITYDHWIYMFNSQAVQLAKENGVSRVTLAVEDSVLTWETLAQKSPLPVVDNVYGNVPLFISANCIRDNLCRVCDRGEKWIKLIKNGKTYLALSKDCQMMLFAEEPLNRSKELPTAVDFYRVDFCYRQYSCAEAAEIWRQITKKRS